MLNGVIKNGYNNVSRIPKNVRINRVLKKTKIQTFVLALCPHVTQYILTGHFSHIPQC